MEQIKLNVSSQLPLFSLVDSALENAVEFGFLDISQNNGLLSRAVYPAAWSKLENDIINVISDTEWLEIKENTGYCNKFSSGDGSTTFRVPFSNTPKLIKLYKNAGEYGEVELSQLLNSLTTGHYVDMSAHNNILMDGLSEVIGIVQLATGNYSGKWQNVDINGNFVYPSKSYFDNHPIYKSFKKVIVNNQVMIEIQPFYFKAYIPTEGDSVGKLCRIISPKPLEGFKIYPSFIKQDGTIGPMYIGKYHGSSYATNQIASLPGTSPIVSLDFPTMKTRCTNNPGFRMWDIYHYSALCHLFLIEHADTNSQLLYKRGHDSGSGAVAVDDPINPVWRGFVGLWSNVWQMVDGFRINTAGNIEIFKNNGSGAFVTTDKSIPSYNGSAVAYCVTVHEDGAGEDWDLTDGYFWSSSNTTASVGSFSDGFWGKYGSAGNVLYVGGDWSYGLHSGLFTAYLSTPASYSHTTIGVRLAT